MVDYAPPWDSMQPPHEMPLSQVRKSAMALANLLDESKDEQVLKEACLGLCQLFGEGIQNDRIQAILEANVVPKLVALLRPSKSRTVPISVQSAALQVLGNVACGDDRQTQVVIDSDALPCLRALLSSSDRGIRKEVCWIVSNITESSHQVQDVLDADILPPLLKLLDNQDPACREDATWVLFNLSSNRDPNQIAYLAEKNGVRALCNLLACTKDLDVLWKGCGTVAAVALKGLRNILVCGHTASSSDPNGYNKMASLVAEAHGVERIEALTNHESADVRNRARLILERMFGTEPTSGDHINNAALAIPSSANTSLSPQNHSSTMGHGGCSCAFQQHQQHSHSGAHYQANGLYDISGNLTTHAISSSHFATFGVEHSLPSHLHPDGDLIDVPGSSSGSSTDSDPEDDDSDSDLIPPPPAPCTCVLCTDTSPLVERRARGKGASTEESEAGRHDGDGSDVRQICDFCSGGGRLGDGRAGLAAKLGRAVRLGHPHCLAVLLSRMSWSQRQAATETPSLLHPGGGPPEGGVGNNLPAVALAAQLGKPDCLALLLRKCRPDLDVTHGKKRLTALAWAAHKSYMLCCQLLLDNGASTGMKCGDGVTALHLAASGGGHAAICKLLIDHSAPVNAKSSKKQTPLCLAAQKGTSKVVNLLLEHGADANNEDEGKYTPLHLAASKGFDNCVELLLRAGACVDTVTRKGVTPLHYAVQGGHASVVRSLIASGAEVNCTHKPLLLIAADDGNVEVVHILLDAHATIDCKANIRAMLDKDTEVSDYLTPLHLAASKAHQEVVELLLSRGANVNEKTSKRGWSALDFAVLNGHADCAVTLLEHGAVVTDNCKTIGRNNWTLVQYAAHHGAKEVVRLLIQRLQEQKDMGVSNVTAGDKADGAATSFQNNSQHFAGVDDGAVNGSYKADEDDGHDDGTHGEYLDDDEGCEHMHEGCPHHPHHHHDSNSSQPTHRYNPRQSEGDEVGFGTGLGYGNQGGGPEAATSTGNSATNANLSTNPSNSNLTTTKSRRRVVKEDRQNAIRAREMRKREVEASEARDRLEEAMNQRSVTKLTEAIQHVSKLVLHLATSVGSDANGGPHGDHGDANGYDNYNNTVGSANGGGGNGGGGGNNIHAHHHHHHHHGPGGHANGGHNCANGGFPAPLAMEVGLGNEVQKARKILAGLLSEEKRIKEEKEKEAIDIKRENMIVVMKKAITGTLQGGDPRSLPRAATRAVKMALDKSEEVILQAEIATDLISTLEKCYVGIKAAMREQNLDKLNELVPRTHGLLIELKKKGGDGAAQRVFAGGDPMKLMNEAERMKKELLEKREEAMAEQRRLKDLEQEAKLNLELAMESNDIVKLELATKKAAEALLSKESELGITIESAKKVLAKWVKGERRKLKQARNSNNPERIEETANAAEKLGLQALQSDIEMARSHAQKLREQSEAKEKLSEAISKADATALIDIRDRLTKLGMFSESDQARAEAERLQNAKRARKLLDDSIEIARTCRDVVLSALSEDVNEDGDGDDIVEVVEAVNERTTRTTTGKSENQMIEELMAWEWPNAQKLHELSERAKKYGDSSAALCATADNLQKELAELGRQVLEVCTKTSDARAIAAMIAGYEKSFVCVATPDVFDKNVGAKAIVDAKKRLADVQARDQESVKAEAAQVKVEYAIATARRSVATRHRNVKVGGQRASQHSGDGSNIGKGRGRTGGSVHTTREHQSHSQVNSSHHIHRHDHPTQQQRFHSPRAPTSSLTVGGSASGNSATTSTTTTTNAMGDRNGTVGTSEGQSHSSMSSEYGDDDLNESELSKNNHQIKNTTGGGTMNSITSTTSGIPGSIMKIQQQQGAVVDSSPLNGGRSHDGIPIVYRTTPKILQKRGRTSNTNNPTTSSTSSMNSTTPTVMPTATTISSSSMAMPPMPMGMSPIQMPLSTTGGIGSSAYGVGAISGDEFSAVAMAELFAGSGAGAVTPPSGDASNSSSVVMDATSATLAMANVVGAESGLGVGGNNSSHGHHGHHVHGGHVHHNNSVIGVVHHGHGHVHSHSGHGGHVGHPYFGGHPSNLTANTSSELNSTNTTGMNMNINIGDMSTSSSGSMSGVGIGGRSSGINSDYMSGRVTASAGNTPTTKRRPFRSMGSGGVVSELSGLTFGGSAGLSSSDLLSGSPSPRTGSGGGIQQHGMSSVGGSSHLRVLNELPSLVDHGQYTHANMNLTLQPQPQQQSQPSGSGIGGPFSAMGGLGNNSGSGSGSGLPGVSGGVSNAMTSLGMMMPSLNMGGTGVSTATTTTSGEVNMDNGHLRHHNNSHHQHHGHHHQQIQLQQHAHQSRSRTGQQQTSSSNSGYGNGRGRGRVPIGMMNTGRNNSSVGSGGTGAEPLQSIGGSMYSGSGSVNDMSNVNVNNAGNVNMNATNDLGLDFENENFGFDINSIVDGGDDDEIGNSGGGGGGVAGGGENENVNVDDMYGVGGDSDDDDNNVVTTSSSNEEGRGNGG